MIFVRDKQKLSFCALQAIVRELALFSNAGYSSKFQMRFSTSESQTFLSGTQAQILDLSLHANVCAQCFSKDTCRYSLHQDCCGNTWTTVDFSQTMTISYSDLSCCKLLLRALLEFFWSLICVFSIYLLY